MEGQNPFSHPGRPGIPFVQRLSSPQLHITSCETTKQDSQPVCPHPRLRPFCDQFPHLYNRIIGLAGLEPLERQGFGFFLFLNFHF